MYRRPKLPKTHTNAIVATLRRRPHAQNRYMIMDTPKVTMQEGRYNLFATHSRYTYVSVEQIIRIVHHV